MTNQTVTHGLTQDEYSVHNANANDGGETVFVTVLVDQSVIEDEWFFQVRCLGAKRHVESGFNSRNAARRAGRNWVEGYDWRGVS